jgi:hypothetical protein
MNPSREMMLHEYVNEVRRGQPHHRVVRDYDDLVIAYDELVAAMRKIADQQEPHRDTCDLEGTGYVCFCYTDYATATLKGLNYIRG